MKNIVLCCDGTANEFAKDRTNVVKLFSTLIQDASVQTVSYHPGLGTMEPSGELSPVRRKLARCLGQAFGYGLPADIRDAYVFLMNNFEAGDRLFMIGFSRGAYTVRSVAALLHMYGLIPRGNEPLVPYAIRMLSSINNKGAQDAKSEYFKLAGEFKATFGMLRECKPWFVGVFDTVSSVGWIENPIHLPYTADNRDSQIGRHAVAIDERRAFFRTNLWRWRGVPPATGPQDLKQVWFPGVHCDVGGGYPESESALSKIALKWMLDEAIAAGLVVDPEKVETILGNLSVNHVKPDPNGKMHKSLCGFWWVAEFIPKRHFDWKRKVEARRMNLGRRRAIPPGSLIHRAAFERGEVYVKQMKLPSDAIKVG